MELNKILHPDLLPEEELRQILESLSIKIPANLPKLELLDIFKKVAVPLPQRNKEPKSYRNQNYINAVIDLNELSLSNNGNNDECVSNHSKRIKIFGQNEEKKHGQDLMAKLEKDSEKMIVDVENTQVSRSVNRKVTLKRTHLFQKEYNNLIKKTKYCEKLSSS